MKVPRRIEMGAVVGGEIYLLDRPALSVRKILGLQPLEELQHARQTLLVIDVLDRGMPARRIGRHIILQWHGNVDQLSRHGASSGSSIDQFGGLVNATQILTHQLTRRAAKALRRRSGL